MSSDDYSVQIFKSRYVAYTNRGASENDLKFDSSEAHVPDGERFPPNHRHRRSRFLIFQLFTRIIIRIVLPVEECPQIHRGCCAQYVDIVFSIE